MNIQQIIKEIAGKKEKIGGIKQVFFVACGGSLTAFYPAKYFLECEALNINIGYVTSNEFVHVKPKRLGENSLVVLASHRGNTPETVEAAKFAQSCGATTIVLTYIKESPICKYADYTLFYEWGDNSKAQNQKPSIGLKIAVAVLHVVEGYSNYQKLMEGFDKIDGLVENAKKHVEENARKFAEDYQNEKNIYVMSSGAGYGSAHQESICVLLEMQWINSASIHSGEYFHGPFEITDTLTPFILLMNEGEIRSLDERALAFLKRYGQKLMVIDAKELGINTIDDSVVDYFNPFLFTNVLGVYNRALAEKRKHPLTQRRYMWKVKY
jgi:fructoselysine 6-phosphate deglycase